MHRSIFVLLACSIILSQGCTNRATYDAMKRRNEVECRRLPPSEYEDCMSTLETNFDHYKNQREDVIKK